IAANRIPAAMWGIPIGSVLLLLNSLVGLHYARRTGPDWHNRIPIVGFDSIDTSSSEGQYYQGTMLGLLSFLPAIALIHLWRLFHGARVVITGDPPRDASSVWDWSALTSLNDPARVCTNYIADKAIACEKNATVLPGLEPTVFAVLTLAAAV